MMNISTNKMHRYIYIIMCTIIYLLFVFMCLFSINSFWVTRDGGFTFSIIHKSFTNIMKLTSLDVHPFLYYFLAKIAISPFKNVFMQISILRILSAIPYLILLIVGNTTLRKRFGILPSILFMFLIITMPVLNNYIYILRMYSWAMLFNTSAFLMLVYVYEGFIRNSFGNFLMISILSLCGAYCHYYSLIILAIMYISFLVLFIYKKRHIANMIYSIFIDIIGYLPWIVILFRQTSDVKKGFWSAPIDIKDIISNVLNMACPGHGTFIHILPILLILLLVLGLLIYHTEVNSITIIGLSIGAFTIMISVIISILLHHSVMQTRYLMPSMGIVWFSIAIFVSNIKKGSFLKHSIFSLLLLIGLISCSFDLWSINKDKQTFNTTVMSFESIPSKSTIIYDNRIPNYISAYHLKNNTFLTKRTPNFYCKVFNMRFKHDVVLNRYNRNNVFFLKPLKLNDSLEHKFYIKYGHILTRKKTIILPNNKGTRIIKYVVYEL